MPLAHEYGGYPRSPLTLDRVEQAWLVVYHDIVLTWITAHHLVEHTFLVDVNEYASRKRVPQAGTFHLVRLKDDVAVRKHDAVAKRTQMRDELQRLGIKALGKGIVQQER